MSTSKVVCISMVCGHSWDKTPGPRSIKSFFKAGKPSVTAELVTDWCAGCSKHFSNVQHRRRIPLRARRTILNYWGCRPCVEEGVPIEPERIWPTMFDAPWTILEYKEAPPPLLPRWPQHLCQEEVVVFEVLLNLRPDSVRIQDLGGLYQPPATRSEEVLELLRYARNKTLEYAVEHDPEHAADWAHQLEERREARGVSGCTTIKWSPEEFKVLGEWRVVHPGCGAEMMRDGRFIQLEETAHRDRLVDGSVNASKELRQFWLSAPERFKEAYTSWLCHADGTKEALDEAMLAAEDHLCIDYHWSGSEVSARSSLEASIEFAPMRWRHCSSPARDIPPVDVVSSPVQNESGLDRDRIAAISPSSLGSAGPARRQSFPEASAHARHFMFSSPALDPDYVSSPDFSGGSISPKTKVKSPSQRLSSFPSPSGPSPLPTVVENSIDALQTSVMQSPPSLGDESKASQ